MMFTVKCTHLQGSAWALIDWGLCFLSFRLSHTHPSLHWRLHQPGVESLFLWQLAFFPASDSNNTRCVWLNVCVCSVTASACDTHSKCVASHTRRHSPWQRNVFRRGPTLRRWVRKMYGSWSTTTVIVSPWVWNHVCWSHTCARPGSSQRWMKTRSSPALSSPTAPWGPVRLLFYSFLWFSIVLLLNALCIFFYSVELYSIHLYLILLVLIFFSLGFVYTFLW